MVSVVNPKGLVAALESGNVSFLVDAVNRVDDKALFDARLLSQQGPDKLTQWQIVGFYSAILTCYSAGPDTASEKAQRRRKIALDKLILMLKKGRLPDDQGRQLVDRLFAQLRFVNEVHADSLAMKIMEEFNPQGSVELAGHSKALEILSHLVSRAGSERRKHLVTHLCEKPWQPSSVVMLASALVDIVETEEECQRALKKIGAYAAWKGFGAATHAVDDADGDALCVDIEELPALLYQLTGLTRKCEGASGTVKGQVLEAIAASLDRLLWAAAPASAPGHATLTPSEKARVDAVLATTVHHLSLLVAKDQGFSAEIVSLIKARRLSAVHDAAVAAGPADGRADPSQAAASPARLLLALLAARAPRQEAKIVNALCEAVFELHTMQVNVARRVCVCLSWGGGPLACRCSHVVMWAVRRS